jgi:hypothetical protein
MPNDREASKPPRPTPSPRPALSEIGRLDSACPACGEALARRPERKTICPQCGAAIFVRMRPFDRKRVLLTEPQASKIEVEWTALQLWERRAGRKRAE